MHQDSLLSSSSASIAPLNRLALALRKYSIHLFDMLRLRYQRVSNDVDESKQLFSYPDIVAQVDLARMDGLVSNNTHNIK